MQSPPPLDLVLAAVRPVGNEVEHHQVNQQADERVVRHTRPELVQVEGAVTGRARHAEQVVEPGLQREKQRDAEQAEAVDQGVEDVGAYRGAVRHRLDRPPALQRADHGQQNQDLDQADHEPGGGFVAVFQQVAQAQRKHHGLHGAFKQPLLHRRKKVFQRVHTAYFAARAGAWPAGCAIQAL